MTKRKSSTRPSVVTPQVGVEGKGGIQKQLAEFNQTRMFLATGSGTTRGESHTV